SRPGPERRLWHRPRDGTRLAGPSAVGVATYQPRAAEGTVLHRVVRENLETFLREAGHRTDGGGLPRFVEREFREFLTCGALGRGFARVRCENCTFERLVPFSCKRRGYAEYWNMRRRPPAASE